MVKKKEEVVEVPEVSDVPKVEASRTPYEVSEWAGLPQYRCRLCPFDTLDEDVMFDHIARLHFTKQVPTVNSSIPSATAEDTASAQGEAVEKADGIFEVDLKEDQNG